MYKYLKILITAFALTIGPASAESAVSATDTTAVIDRFHAALLDVMHNAASLGIKGRFDTLSDPITRSFNMGVMTRIAAGQTIWADASEEERKNLVAAFSRLSISTYAARFNGFSGESFRIVSEEEGPRSTRVIHTQIVRPDDTPIDISYVMRQADDTWQIIDVLLTGSISELAVRRSEYRRILSDDGVGALTRELNEKAARLLTP